MDYPVNIMNTSYDLPKDMAHQLVDAEAYADLDRLHATYTRARANNPIGRVMADGHDPVLSQ